MKLRQLEAFRAVLVHGSITAAAKAMHVSQPGVSRLIGDLERSVEFKLFERRKGRLYPTPEGLSFHQELERSFIGLSKLRQAAREIRDHRRGHLRLAVMPSVSLDLAPEIVCRFTRDNPGIKVTLDAHTSPRIAEWVAAQHFDLGFAQTTLDLPGVEVMHSFRTAFVCVAALGHPIRDKAIVRAQDLEGEPFIALAQHTLAALQIDQAFMEANARRLIRVETQPSFAACSMAAKGIGVALVDPMTAAFFGEDKLVIRNFEPEVHFDFRIIRPANVITSRAAEAFVETAVALFAESPIVNRL